jgi:hypothetical protein
MTMAFAWFGDDEVDRGCEAERWLNDRHNANLGQCVADLVDGRKTCQQILSDMVGLSECAACAASYS